MVGRRRRFLFVLPLLLALAACGAQGSTTATTGALGQSVAEGRAPGTVPDAAHGAQGGHTSPGTTVPAVASPTVIAFRDGPFPPGCQPDEVGRLLSAFFAAFNRGDGDELARFFPPDASFSPVRLQWYSVTDAQPDGQQRHFVTHRRAPLLAYFHERHQQHEQLQLRKLWVNAHDSGAERVDIWYFLTRRAGDLPAGFGGPEGLATGKGGIHCPTQTIYVWSMGQRSEAPPGMQVTPNPVQDDHALQLGPR